MLCSGFYSLLRATLLNTETIANLPSNSSRTFDKGYSTEYSSSVANSKNESDTSSEKGYFILAGSGDTPVVYSDRKLSNVIGSGLSLSSCSLIHTFDVGSSFKYIISRSFTNSSSSNITIKEVGLYYKVGSGVSPTLLAREVLPKPITLAPGETTTLTASLFNEGV